MLMLSRSFEHYIVSAETVLNKVAPLITCLPGYFDGSNRETLTNIATLFALTTS